MLLVYVPEALAEVPPYPTISRLALCPLACHHHEHAYHRQVHMVDLRELIGREALPTLVQEDTDKVDREDLQVLMDDGLWAGHLEMVGHFQLILAPILRHLLLQPRIN